MVKSTTVKNNLDSVGKGILNSLEESSKEQNSENPNGTNNDKTNSLNKEKNTNSNTNKSNSVNSTNAKNNIKEKSKTSFMLDSNTSKQLKLLNLALEKDLSDLVTEAIDLLYRKNEKKIEQVIADYFATLKK